MKQQIFSRHTNAVIYECELPDGTENAMRAALVKAVAERANLGDANLGGVNLRDANLRGVNLSGVNLGGVNLDGVNLGDANLRYANLRYANLRGANLGGANLRYANLVGANLVGANLRDANLDGANLHDANLDGGRKLIGDRPYFSIGPIGSRLENLKLWLTDKGPFLEAGCFFGTFEEFETKLNEDHGDNDYAKEYRSALLMCEAHAVIWTPKIEMAV